MRNVLETANCEVSAEMFTTACSERKEMKQ